MVGILDIADAFFDAVVSAWLGYLISQMLFRCGGICKSGVFDIADAFLMRRYLQEWDIRCCGCFFPATHV